MNLSLGLGVGLTDLSLRRAGQFAIDATAEAIRNAILSPQLYSNGGWIIPGTVSAKIQASARASVAMQQRRDDLLGPELIVNGGFDTGTTGWTANNATQSVVSGELAVVSAAGASDARSSVVVTTVIGRSYQITLTLRAAASNSVANSARAIAYTDAGRGTSYFAAIPSQTPGVTRSVSAVFVATTATAVLDLQVASSSTWGAAGDTAYFDNVSVREVIVPAGGYEFAPHNLLLWSDDLTNASWIKSGVTVTLDPSAPPFAGLAVHRCQFGGGNSQLYQSSGLTVGAQYATGAWIRSATGGNQTLRLFTATGNSTDRTITPAWQYFAYSDTHASGTFYGFRTSTALAASDVLIAAPSFCLGSSISAYVPTTTSAVYAPAIDWLSGIGRYGVRSEEARTNVIRNSAMVGAASGSPGTYPTNYLQYSDPPLGTITRTITAGVSLDGLPAIDVRFQFTASSDGRVFITVDGSAFSAGSFATQARVRGVAGTFSGVTFLINTVFRDGASTLLSDNFGTSSPVALNTTLPYGFVDLAPTNTATAETRLSFSVASAGTYDFTVRIACPQLESGATATSPILTYGATATRAADDITVPGAGWISQTEGTLIAGFFKTAANAPLIYNGVAVMGDGGSTNLIGFFVDQPSIANVVSEQRSGSTTPVAQFVTSGTSGANTVGIAYALNNTASSQNGSTPATDTTAALPATAMTSLRLGVFDARLMGHITRVRYAPQRLPNATLQALTA